MPSPKEISRREMTNPSVMSVSARDSLRNSLLGPVGERKVARTWLLAGMFVAGTAGAGSRIEPYLDDLDSIARVLASVAEGLTNLKWSLETVTNLGARTTSTIAVTVYLLALPTLLLFSSECICIDLMRAKIPKRSATSPLTALMLVALGIGVSNCRVWDVRANAPTWTSALRTAGKKCSEISDNSTIFRGRIAPLTIPRVKRPCKLVALVAP